jgi:predicted nucleotidyltransferase
MESGATLTLDEVRSVVSAHREDLRHLRVRSLRVFGSVARGEARPTSDVDFLVELDRPAGLLTLGRIKLALEAWLGRRVDIGTAESLRPELREEVLREAVDAG